LFVTAAFFPGDWLMQALLAFICYAGILLNGIEVSVRGLRREPMEALVTVLFIGLLPVPFGSGGLWLLQFAIVLLALGSLGALQLRFALARYRVVKAYERGATATPIGVWTTLLLFAPVLALAIYPVLNPMARLLVEDSWRAPMHAAEVPAVLAAGVRWAFLMVMLFAAYVAVASRLDQAWLRVVGRIRLLSSDARFVWINVFMGMSAAVSVAFLLVFGVESMVGRFALVAIIALSLIPAINGLSWMYDAVFRRILTFHVLLAIAAVLVAGTRTVFQGLGLAPAAWWPLALASLAVAAMVLPERIDSLLERWLFPRTSRMRARLLALAAEPLLAAGRADAAAELLRRLVAVLDSTGGVAVVHPSGHEPAAVRAAGDVEAAALGATDADAAAYVRALGPDGGPHLVENLPLADQIRLLHCGVVLVCPLAGRERQATFLLAPRRGWLYDVATVQALRVFASQAGFALENLALAGARAHAEKLAALGEAAARIAHEIRNPLTAARSLVQQAASADGVAGLAAPAIEELDRIGRLVADLLAFARRDDVQARTGVDIEAVCRAAVVQVAPLAAQAGVDIGVEGTNAVVLGDRNRLVQAVTNLCRNAIEALAASLPPRRVTVRCAAADGSAVIEVCDNGPGIPPGEPSRLFEPFATTKSAGTGLGLPIARRIVEAHGGRLTVESTPGAYTVFRVELPLAGVTSRPAL
jgi:signal transduction histidine kinase